MKNKIPAMQWYTGDWLKAPDVRALSPAARGVWFDLLNFMWESEDRGKLVTKGRALTDEELARMTGLDASTAQQILSTIRNTGVSGVDQKTGAMMCRRMVRYEEIRRMKSRAGASKRQQNANRTPIKTQQRGGPSGCCPSGTGPSGTGSSDPPPSPPSEQPPQPERPPKELATPGGGASPSATPTTDETAPAPPQPLAGGTAETLAREYTGAGGVDVFGTAARTFKAALLRLDPKRLQAAIYEPLLAGRHAWEVVRFAERGTLAGEAERAADTKAIVARVAAKLKLPKEARS